MAKQIGAYKRPWYDRIGRDDGTTGPVVFYAILALTPVFLGIGYLVAQLLGVSGVLTLAFMLGFAAVSDAIVFFVAQHFARSGAKGFTRFTHPDGSTTPYQRQFSYQEALAAKGLVDDALVSYEAEIVAAPGDVEAIMRTAELYLTHRRRPERAAELLRMLQRTPTAPPEKVLYATHRLVDLYLGPLDDSGKALVELRRLIDNFPGSQAARFAREALAKLKREHHGTGADG
jgi:hypothetical protein